MTEERTHYDFIIIGSGFGGSVSALRLCEKGYRVLMIEKGRRFSAEDFPKTNWDLRRFMWMPEVGFLGPFKMSFFRHVTILHGVGVGGGSLVYANTLPVPKQAFFESGSWSGLADWAAELEPFYARAKEMLGATSNPHLTHTDRVLAEVGEEMGRGDHFHPTDVAVFFGKPGKTVPDPYFGGKGPERTGCTLCGACMTGCRHGAKNTLDKNYLYLAEQLGLDLVAETEVTGISPREEGGYLVQARRSHGWRRPERSFSADKVVLAGGVMGTLPLLLKMKQGGLPRLSDRLGEMVRTNNESLIGVVTADRSRDLSKGIAIGSILHTSDDSHVEPVRYGEGSGFFRTMSLPHASGMSFGTRMRGLARAIVGKRKLFFTALTVPDFAKQSTILLYMESLEGTMALRWSSTLGRMKTVLMDAAPPTATLPVATEIAEKVARRLNGITMTLFAETLFNVPTTAHILGGACMGESPEHGVIDSNHEVFGYPGLYVVDGSAISANPGVNPSLSITALAERAMSRIPAATPR